MDRASEIDPCLLPNRRVEVWCAPLNGRLLERGTGRLEHGLVHIGLHQPVSQKINTGVSCALHNERSAL